MQLNNPPQRSPSCGDVADRDSRETFMNQAEIAATRPESPPADNATSLQQARERMQRTGQWHAGQMLGRRWSIGCVALEVTQRCNLDCTLCYLSEMSEAVQDIPLSELFRRIDTISRIYGPGTGVQITGGDPTLRRCEDLVAIVRRIRDRGMRPSLFTNGIKASRAMLAELAAGRLADVAFHVDTTQQRKGFATESELNAIRREYIDRTCGLPIAVFFNTTVHDGNLHEIPDVARLFVAHSDRVSVASFQMQADTGRGIQRGRTVTMTRAKVADRIAAGAGTPIRFLSGIGHHRCNGYAVTLVANGHVHDITADPSLVAEALTATSGLAYDHTSRFRRFRRLIAWGVSHPGFLLRGAHWAARTLWALKRDLLASRGRVHRLTFFIHDFMDACHLEHDRIASCAFMVATVDGPVSMCLHNARRDSYILKPIRITTPTGETIWNPLTGDGRPRRHVPPKGRRRATTHRGRLPTVR